MTPEQLLRQIFGETGPAKSEDRRPANTTPLFRLADELPEFAAEFHQLLLDDGQTALAEQVPNLQIFDRCDCGNCGTMYTVPRPESSFGPERGGLSVSSKRGSIYIDTVAGQIACIEVLDRPEITKGLLALIP